LQDKRIHAAATLRDGDRVGIGDHEFTFQIAADHTGRV
jgi:SARP family transcriptional regulator, regulator of embCAB operon